MDDMAESDLEQLRSELEAFFQAAIASMADRVVRLADGRVVAVEDRTGKLAPAQLSW